MTSSDRDVNASRASVRQKRRANAPRVGEIVAGSFQLLQEIGHGSFATAYLAEQLGTDRHAVVKIPHRHLLKGAMGNKIRSRFAAELRASTRVNHPNVATVYTAGDTEDGVPVIAMEYVPGLPLISVLEAKAPLSPRSIARLGMQIVSALNTIHSVGIVHRDVTPRNIVASTGPEGKERYVLLDFGVAKIEGLPSQTTGPLGTPRYMPREQIQGRPVSESDMFGLGAILWWALVGEEYLNQLEDIHSVLAHQLEETCAPDLQPLKPTVPLPLAQLVSRLLHPDANVRPSAQQFLDEWPGLMRHWAAVLKRGAAKSSRLPSEGISEKNRHATKSGNLGSTGLGSVGLGSAGLGADSAGLSPAQSLDEGIDARGSVTVLLIDSNPVSRGALQESLASVDCMVIPCTPEKALERIGKGQADLVLVAQRVDQQRGQDVLLRLRAGRSKANKPVLALVVHRDAIPVDWDQVAEHCIALPGDLTKIQSLVTGLRPSRRDLQLGTFSALPSTGNRSALGTESPDRRKLQTRMTIEQVAGSMPECIEDLHEAIARADSQCIESACRQISDSAHAIGAEHLARLSEMLQQLVANDLLDQAAGFAAEIEEEFHSVFRELLHRHRTCY